MDEEQQPNEESTDSPRPRRRWAAFLASLVLPGLGHVYAGSLVRGVLAWAVCSGAVYAWFAVLTNQEAELSTVVKTAAGVAGVWLLVAVHAAWRAGVRRHGVPRRPPSKAAYWGFLTLVVVGTLAQGYWVYAGWVYVYEVKGEVALPGLSPGDWVIVNRSAYNGAPPEPGELAVFWLAKDRDGLYTTQQRPHATRVPVLMRVVGQPHDKVSVRRGVLYLNKLPVPTKPTGKTHLDAQNRELSIEEQTLGQRVVKVVIDPNISQRGMPASVLNQIQEMPRVIVDRDHFFLLGDNRHYTVDSRFWGLLHKDDLIGPVVRVIVSRDSETGSIRWGRTGQLVE